MTVWNVDKNAEAKTMVITAEFKTSITNVWQLWADPRRRERWWGPPGFQTSWCSGGWSSLTRESPPTPGPRLR